MFKSFSTSCNVKLKQRVKAPWIIPDSRAGEDKRQIEPGTFKYVQSKY